MLQKVVSNYTTPISKFKANPNAALAEAEGDAIAISSHNEIQFYAVPAKLYEDMTAYIEYLQHGRALKSIPAEFMAEDLDMDQVAKKLADDFMDENVSLDYDEYT